MKHLFTLLSVCVALSGYTQAASNDRVYTVWDNQPAPNRGGDYNISKARGYPYDEDWELRSYPLGNG